ncbi:MAG TPA: hypothetical protein VI583_06285 [Cyclobacteriaceae bacterium]|nr:hypothetical protein [Cyclobacteriaceae bacterium]
MNQNIAYYGSPNPQEKKYPLKAGPLSLVYQNGFVRHMHIGNSEVVNMIYFAVRDQYWRTYHGVIKNEKVKESARGFDISYRTVISEQSIQYVFDCSIKGNSEGSIEFVIKGESFGFFKANRIGFCILHSTDVYSGKPFLVRHSDKTETEGTFPLLAEPHQPYINMRGMAWEPLKGWSAELKFDGDIFEMEDQRNWSDGSYKTYCTPLSNPYPVDIKMGEKIKQKISLQVTPLRKDALSKVKARSAPELTVARGAAVHVLPGLGLSDTSQYNSYSDNDLKLLRPLGIHHLRIEFDLTEPGIEASLEKIAKKGVVLEAPLMIILTTGDNPESQVSAFAASASKLNLHIESITLLDKESPSTPAGLINAVADILRTSFPGARIGGGTGRNFAELNRNRIPDGQIDFLTFPSSPQAHLADNMIMLENLAGMTGALMTARSFSAGKGIYISPITLKPRAGKKTTQTGSVFNATNILPADVDPLQTSLFAAGWTLGVIKYLSEAGADFLTFFETTGWRGIIQGSAPSPMPSLFYANANAAFPVYFVFRWIGKLAGSGVIPAISSDPLTASGLTLLYDKSKYLLIANHTDSALDLPVTNFKNGMIISRLNEKNINAFMNDAAGFFEKSKEEPFENVVKLMPLELMVLRSGK